MLNLGNNCLCEKRYPNHVAEFWGQFTYFDSPQSGESK
jgi:hypothetical protein